MNQRSFQSRKFLFALFFTLAGTGLLVGSYITGEQWVWLAAAVMSLYGGANVLNRYVTKGKE